MFKVKKIGLHWYLVRELPCGLYEYVSGDGPLNSGYSDSFVTARRFASEKAATDLRELAYKNGSF
jgi:hypothetical protein